MEPEVVEYLTRLAEWQAAAAEYARRCAAVAMGTDDSDPGNLPAPPVWDAG